MLFSLPNLLLRKSAGLDYEWDLEGNIGYCPNFTDDELFCSIFHPIYLYYRFRSSNLEEERSDLQFPLL